MTLRKVKKETSVNSQTGTWLRILPWVGSVNGARVTLRERAERDRAGGRLLSGRCWKSGKRQAWPVGGVGAPAD